MLHIKRLPAPDESIREAYCQLVAEIDEMVKELSTTRFAKVLQCKPGCEECCMRFSVLPIEAAIVVEALNNIRMPNSNNSDKCVLLNDGLCQVYTSRPIICRTQGLPLGYIDEINGAIDVSACFLNFSEGCQFVHDDLLYMDEINQRLVECNLAYALSIGIEPAQRFDMASIVSTF